MDQLLNLTDRVHACDTEVMDIDVKKQSPICHGQVTCASIYAGKDVDFGNGPTIWIDNIGQAYGLSNIFKPYFESESVKKCWNNYGLDRHIMYNHKIDCKGFGGDTMHMARLNDTSLPSYSLENLCDKYA